jgi:hypothetical protein
MAKPEVPPKAKLFIGILYSDENACKKAEKILKNKYGPVDQQTDPILFDHTSYYDSMGPGLKKIIWSFTKLINREDIVKVKLHTNKIESSISGKGSRIINVDPGYLTLSNVFLASCKEFYHRIYLGRGIYLENEYRYASKQFHFWEWTYPDYKKKEYLDFFYAVRKKYHEQIKDKLH